MRQIILGALILMPLQARAETDYIAPGSPATVGQGGALLGKEPDHPVLAPRGTLRTFGFSDQREAPVSGSQISRDEARKRIEQAGFSHVIDLLMDSQGVWRGRAEKGDRAMDVHCTGAGVVAEG